MAPEFIKGIYSHKIDVHSFGMVLLSLLNGSEPYEGPLLSSPLLSSPLLSSHRSSGMTGVEVIKSVCRGALPELPTWPPVLIDLVRQCLNSSPQNRPEFNEILKKLCSDDSDLYPPTPDPGIQPVLPNVVEDIESFVRASSQRIVSPVCQ
jgi:serine/threonine protein kinase